MIDIDLDTGLDTDTDTGGRAALRAFFGPRAAGWEDRFPGDEPAYAAAVEALAPRPGGTALDAACGTGRALPILRRAVGADGLVVGVDITPEMLAEAAGRGRHRDARLVLGDVRRLPLGPGTVDAVLAAGLVGHHGDAVEVLAELARVTAPGGWLALFHPISRAALAARHGQVPDPDDLRAEHRIRPLLDGAGFEPEMVDDGPDRYLVIGRRR